MHPRQVASLENAHYFRLRANAADRMAHVLHFKNHWSGDGHTQRSEARNAMNVECRQSQDCVVSPQEVERRVRNAVNKHEMFRGRANNFDFVVRDHVLTLRGKVPSFYLKQMLQTVVKSIEGVQAVKNYVEVIS